jgi:hypothetical protein
MPRTASSKDVELHRNVRRRSVLGGLINEYEPAA